MSTPEISHEAQAAIDALGCAHDAPCANRTAVEAMLSSIAAGNWGADEQAFARALGRSLYGACREPGGSRADAVLRASGLAGDRVDPDLPELEAFVTAHESMGISTAEALRRAEKAKLLPHDYDEPKERERIRRARVRHT